MAEERQKKTIFFCPGQEYLFYTSGIYNLWELSREYRVILLLDSPFKDVDILERLKRGKIIEDFLSLYYCLDHCLPLVRAYMIHRYYFKISKELFDRYEPDTIIQHTDLEPVNIYLFERAEEKKCTRIILKSGLTSKNQNNDYLLLRIQNIDRLMHRWHIPYWLAFIYYTFIKAFSYYLNYCLCPFLIEGHFLKPRINPFFINDKWFNNRLKYFDYSLTYTEKEQICLLTSGEQSHVIQFSLFELGEQVFDYIYGPIEEKNEIIIFPTDIEPDYFKEINKLSGEDVMQHFLRVWSEVLGILRVKFPSYKLYIKLRPADSDDNLYNRVIELLSEYDKTLVVLSPETDVWKLILRSKVIISGASTVLWWANHLKRSKVLISLNLFGVLHGDCYLSTDGILYFEDTKSLVEFDFAKTGLRKRITPAPTLTEFINNHKVKNV